MGQRQQLHNLLLTLADRVYFQPPENLTMTYPCIVYSRESLDNKFADNQPYLRTKRYQVTVIDRTPDSDIFETVSALPMCSYDRHFVADQLHHDVFSIYF